MSTIPAPHYRSLNRGSAAEGRALRDNLIWGVQEIAEEIGKTRTPGFPHVDRRDSGRQGWGQIVASRSRLRHHFNALLDGSRS